MLPVEGNPGQDQTRPSRVSRMVAAARSWLTARPRNAGYAGVLAALALTVPFGGLAAAPQEQTPRTPAGEQVAIAPWEVTWDRAIYGPDLGGVMGEEGAMHMLITGQLRTTHTETVPSRDLTSSVLMRTPGLIDDTGREVEVGAAPHITYLYVLEPTPQPLTAISPGLTYGFGMHLTMPAGQSPPEQIELELQGKTYRQSSLDDSYLWTDPVTVTTVSVPTQRSGPVFESPWSLAP